MHALKPRRPAFARGRENASSEARPNMPLKVMLQIASIGVMGALCGFVGGLLIEEICLNLI